MREPRDVESAFGLETGEVTLGGSAPLPLDSAAAVWLVEAGTVEVFAAPRNCLGARTHLCAVPSGQALFGAAPREGLGLIAVGHAGARLRRLERAELRAMAREPAMAARLAEQIDTWLNGLFREILRASPPMLFQELRPGAETRLGGAGRIARAREGVVWVRHLEGRSLLLGEEGLELGWHGVMPVPEGTWLTGSAEVRLFTFDTASLLRRKELWEGLARFHDLFLRFVLLQLERLESQERERLERRASLDRATLQGAYARLASVLDRLPRIEARPDEAADPLLAACRLVGEAEGIPICARGEARTEESQGDGLARICAASRVRSRRVILRDDWWRRDNGALLGSLVIDPEVDSRRPVALLPTSPRSYEMVDPVAGTRTPVDDAVAERLSGEAHMLYPPLPERPVTWKDLLRLAFRNRRSDLVTLIMVGIAGGLLGLLIPILTGQVFGNVIPGADRGQLLQITLALIVSACAAAVFQVTRGIAVLRLGGKMDGAVQAAVWDRLLSLPVSFFREFTVGDLANRSMGIDTIRELLTGNVITSILSAAFSVFSFVLLFYYSWRLALFATALVLLLVGVTTGLIYLQIRHQRELLRLQGKIASLVFGQIHGIAKLRVGGAEARAFAQWAESFALQRQRTMAAQRPANAQSTFNAVYGVLTSMAIFAAVGFSSEADLSLGRFLAFNAAFGQFLSAAFSMVSAFSSILVMVPIYERLEPILKTVPEVDESKAEPGELSGEIEFSHVSFRYQQDGPLILDDVSFRARPGEFVALVGPSGAGKSTCLRLILGFEKPTSGSIYFDSQDLASLAVQSVRRQIGVVLQTGLPMAGSIFSNIVGSASLGIEDAWEAARMAGLEEDIKAMPMGMHTVVSEGAETFSGGQKQRILIARAVVHRPRIVLFDEATSALDNRTQEVVSRSLEQLKATRVVIAHRLSTILNADRIYVLEGGRIVEEGIYSELVRMGGLFSRLVERQIA